MGIETACKLGATLFTVIWVLIVVSNISEYKAKKTSLKRFIYGSLTVSLLFSILFTAAIALFLSLILIVGAILTVLTH